MSFLSLVSIADWFISRFFHVQCSPCPYFRPLRLKYAHALTHGFVIWGNSPELLALTKQRPYFASWLINSGEATREKGAWDFRSVEHIFQKTLAFQQ